MKWTYNLKNKFLASLALLSLCLLVLLSNHLDRKHTESVTNSIATLYEDRLIAEDYILKMTSNIYQIREVLYSDLDSDLKSNSISKIIEEFNDRYNFYIKTKLTTIEETTAIELKSYVKILEQKNLNNNYDTIDDTDKALISLNKLSNVQLDESKLIMKNVESEYATIKASSQFAFAIIIVILVVLQAIVFSAKNLIPVTKSEDAEFN